MIQYSDETLTLTASPRRGTLRDGVRLALARAAAEQVEYANGSEWYFACHVYPALISATPTGTLVIEGEAQPWPPTYEQTVDLIPAPAIDTWLQAVYDLNPDWKPPFALPDETQEKKDDLPSGTTPPTG